MIAIRKEGGELERGESKEWRQGKARQGKPTTAMIYD
jgi:hypothetical protein